jgi:anaerobic selenocysteine-containing dehydrogenase
VPTAPGGAAAALRALTEPGHDLGQRLRGAERAILVWSGPGGGGGARLAEAAHALGFSDKPGCGAFHLPATANGGGVALAWAAASDEDETNPEPIGLLIVFGVEAAADAGVRALAETAEHVIAVTMFHGVAVGWADLVLPSTSPLERDGTLINLEGRLQRQRRTVTPPVPDELAWIAKLAERFEVALSPHTTVVFDELSTQALGNVAGALIGVTADLPPRAPYAAPAPAARA